MAHRGFERRPLRPACRAVRSPTRSASSQGRRVVLLRARQRGHAGRARTSHARRRAPRAGRALRARGTARLGRRDTAFRGRRARRPAPSGRPVAVVCARLDRALARPVRSRRHRADAAYADSAAVPAAGAGCTLLLDESAALRSPRRRAALRARRDEPLAGALDLALGRRAPRAESGEHVTFYAGTAEYERHRESIEGLRDAHRDAAGQAAARRAAAPARGAGGDRRRRQPAAGCLRPALLARQRDAPMAPAGVRSPPPWRCCSSPARRVTWWQQSRAEKRARRADAEIFAQALPGQPVVDPRAADAGRARRAGARLAPACCRSCPRSRRRWRRRRRRASRP